MKKDKIIYWTATSLVCAVMALSAINFNLKEPFGPTWPEGDAFVHLGLPDYIRIELSVAKLLGVLALLVPGVPSWMRAFAYCGFAITLVSASIAHFASGDGMMFIIDPLLFLGALIVSYRYSGRIKNYKTTLNRKDTGAQRRLQEA